MRPHLVLSAIAFFTLTAQAQNFVPNWSFEDHSACPDDYGQVERCTGWHRSWNNNDPTYHTEYLNACGTSMFSEPGNTWGFQDASTGQGYMAEVSMAPTVMTDYRENIYAQLLRPLQVGTEYRVSLKISNCDNSKYASNNFGVKFATVTSFPIDGVCALHVTDVVTDKDEWTTITGTFTADSAYTYLAVGNFIPDANTTTEMACPACSFNLYGYYVDDVCVMEKHGSFEGDCLVDVLSADVHETSAAEFRLSAKAGIIDLQRNATHADPAVVTVTDASGGICLRSTWAAGQLQLRLDLQRNSSGVYLVQVATSKGTATKRIVLAP